MATVIESEIGLRIEGDRAHYVSPEGQHFEMSVQDLLAAAQQQLLPACSGLLPRAVRAVFRRGRFSIWAAEFSPAVRPVKWIVEGSPVPFGKGVQYGAYNIAMPYVVLLAVFDGATLSGSNECFFRTEPLSSMDDELLYPALLNVSRIEPQEGHSLSWVCTQFLDRNAIEAETDPARRMSIGWRLLCETLFDGSFNLSSEHHEGASWYGQSKSLDKRLATIDAWDAATKEDPSFIFDIPFHKTGHTLAQVAERIFKNLNQGQGPQPVTVDDLARLLINHTTAPRKPR